MLVYFMRAKIYFSAAEKRRALILAVVCVLAFAYFMGESFVSKFQEDSNSYFSYTSRSMDDLIDLKVLTDHFFWVRDMEIMLCESSMG